MHRLDKDDFVKILKQKLNKNHRETFSSQDLMSTHYRRAAVLCPFVWVETEWHLLFTRRSDSLKNHRGQVSFPGGARDPEDAHAVDTALREAFEEIGVSRNKVTIVGEMGEMVTNSNYLVTPVIAVLDWPQPLRLSQNEVSRVFTIPISWLADKNNWEERVFNHPSGWYGTVIFYEKYDGELLWGITASITHQLIDLIK